MKESKTIKARPNEVDSVINENENFGWELLSNQRVHSSEPMASTSIMNGVYIHENYTDDYSYLTFQRNTKMQNYIEIVDLEKQYYDLQWQLSNIHLPLMPTKSNAPIKIKRKANAAYFFGVLFLVSGIYFPIAAFALGQVDMPAWGIILFIIAYVCIGVALLFYGSSSNKAYEQEEKAAEEEYEKQKISVEKKKQECDESIHRLEKQIKEVRKKAWTLIDL